MSEDLIVKTGHRDVIYGSYDTLMDLLKPLDVKSRPQPPTTIMITVSLTLLVRGGGLIQPPPTKYRFKSGYLGARTPQTH